jgi:hypothetical protein
VACDYNFWVYVVTNRKHSVLYIGVTNSLLVERWEHREGAGAGFSSAYRCKELIYYEEGRADQSVQPKLARFEQRHLARQLTVRGVSTSLDMTRKENRALKNYTSDK